MLGRWAKGFGLLTAGLAIPIPLVFFVSPSLAIFGMGGSAFISWLCFVVIACTEESY